jgi:hypothetical protein
MSIFVFVILIIFIGINAFIWGNKSEEPEIEKTEDPEVETGLLVSLQHIQQLQRQLPSTNNVQPIDERPFTLQQRNAVLQNTQQMRTLVQQNSQRKRKKKTIKKQIPEKIEKQINNKFDFMGKTDD